MLSEIIYPILIIIALFFAMSFSSIVEMAFASLNRARIKTMAENGNKRAALVLKLHGRFDEIITTMLLLGYGLYFPAATLSTVLFIRALGEAGAVVSGIVMTVLAVIFSDDFPKSIAKSAPEKFAMFFAPLVWALLIILKPVSFLLVAMKRRINAKFFSKEKASNTEDVGFRGEELLYVVEEAQQDGSITAEDSFRISNAIEFNDLLVEDILTSRVDIVSVSKTASIADVTEIFLESGYSRLPVHDENLDNILGVIYIKDFLKCTANKANTLKDVMTPVVYTALVTQVSELFKLLQKEKKRLAIVVDEFGGTQGLVTMEDILIELVGDIWDESDEADEVIDEFVDIGENKHKVLCSADIYKMFEYFGLEGDSNSLTVGGWIIDVLERLPQKGDSFTYEKLTVTVTKANPKRAEECIVEVDAERKATTATDENIAHSDL